MDVKYRGIPIALMTNFYQQIDSALRTAMERSDFAAKLKYASINELSQIQPFFEKILAPLKKPLLSQADGKVLINLDYTRIPIMSMHEHFSPERTIILSRSKSKDYHGIPNEFIGNYKRNKSGISDKLISEVMLIFAKNENHPAFGNSFFLKTFIERIPIIVETLDMAFNLFNKNHIGVVLIGTTEDITSRSLAFVASRQAIPCICLQHGLLIGEEAFIPMFASHAAVFGEYEKKWYLSRGLEEDRIKPIGHPKFDEIFHSSRISKSAFLEEHNLDPDKMTLLIATGPYINPKKFTTMISKLVKNQNFQLIIKPHPWEIGKKKIDLYIELQRKYSSVHVVTNRKVNTHDLIFHSNCVLATLSTVGLESCLFNKPLFIYYFVESNRYYDYYDRLGKFISTEPIEVTKVVSSYFNDEKERRDYEEIKKKFLLDSYRNRNSGKELSNLIYQLTGIRTK